MSQEDTKDGAEPPIIPTEKPTHLISRAEKKRLSAQIDGKFRNRPSADEMYMRGIIDWNPDDAAEAGDYTTFRHYKEDNLREISERLNNRISHKFRPSKSDLELRGIVPRGAWEDFTHVAEDRDLQNSIRSITLTRHIAQRPNPEEMRQSKIFQPGDTTDLWGHEDLRDRKKRASMDLTWRYGQRATLDELVARGIVPPEYARTLIGRQDHEAAEAAARRRSRMTKDKLSMRFSNRATPQHVLARGIVDEAYLYLDAGAVVMEKRKSKMEAQDALSGMLNKLKNLQQQALDAVGDGGAEALDVDEITFRAGLGPPTSEERFKRASVDLEWRVADRQELEDVIARGIVHPAFQEVLKGNKDHQSAVADQAEEADRIRQRVEMQIGDRMGKDEAIARGIVGQEEFEKDHADVVRRQRRERAALQNKMAMAVAARPHKTALEERGITYPANIAPLANVSPQPSPEPRGMTEADVLRERMMDAAVASARQAAYDEKRAEYNASHIPGGLMFDPRAAEADPMFRPRIEREKSLNAFISSKGRPMPRELVERGIVPSGYWQDPKNAMLQHNIERDQARINFEAAFRARDNVADLVSRGFVRPEFMENRDDPSAAADLIKGKQLRYSRALALKLDPKTRLTPEEMQARGFVPYHVTNDNLEQQMSVIDRIKTERKNTRARLDGKLHPKRRPSFQALQARGIVPIHWYDADESNYTVDGTQFFSGRTPAGERVNIEIHPPENGERSGPGSYGHGRRMSKATAFETMFDQLKQKPTLMQEMAEKLLMDQLVRAGHMDGEDIAKLEDRKKAKKKSIRRKLNRKLSQDFRPTPSELEKRNIVPTGYWSDMKKAFSTQHRRRKTAEQELGEALANRMAPAQLVSKGYASEDFMKMVYNGSRDAPRMGPVATGRGVRSSRSTSPVLHEEKVSAVPTATTMTRPAPSSRPSGPLIGAPPLPSSTSVKMDANRNRDGDWQTAVLGSAGNGVSPASSSQNATTRSSGAPPTLTDDASDALFFGNSSSSAMNGNGSWMEMVGGAESWNEKRESLVNSLSFLSIYESISHGIRSRKEELDFLSDVIDSNDSNMRHTRSASQAATIRDAAAAANEKQIRYEKEVEALQRLFGRVRAFEDAFLETMNGLVDRKRMLLEQTQESREQFEKACEYMGATSSSQSRLVDKINLNMRVTLRKIRAIEDVMTKNSKHNSQQMASDLQFHKYILVDYQRMLDEMSAARKSISDDIESSDAVMQNAQRELEQTEDEIRGYEQESTVVLDEFRAELPNQVELAKPSRATANQSNSNGDRSALNIRIEHRDDVSDLSSAVRYRTAKIESDLRILEKRTNHLNTVKYVSRIAEIVQLQMILRSPSCRKFYEMFVKNVNIAFTEISFAHTIFDKVVVKGNTSDVWVSKKEGIPSLATIAYIASITPGDTRNEVSYEQTLMRICGEMQSYICSLPDRDAVIYHVARHLTSHRIRRAEIEQIDLEDDDTMTQLVTQRVHEWIRALLSTKYTSDGSRGRDVRAVLSKNDDTMIFDHDDVTAGAQRTLVRSNSVTSDSFGLIAASRRDILAQVRTSRAASIVLHRVYGIHLDI